MGSGRRRFHAMAGECKLQAAKIPCSRTKSPAATSRKCRFHRHLSHRRPAGAGNRNREVLAPDQGVEAPDQGISSTTTGTRLPRPPRGHANRIVHQPRGSLQTEWSTSGAAASDCCDNSAGAGGLDYAVTSRAINCTPPLGRPRHDDPRALPPGMAVALREGDSGTIGKRNGHQPKWLVRAATSESL